MRLLSSWRTGSGVCWVGTGVVCLLAGSMPALAQVSQPASSTPPAETSRWANLRWTSDFSTRTSFDPITKRFSFEQAIGLDTHLVLTGPKGDLGTFVLQGYLTRIDNVASHPAFFDDTTDWEMVLRIFSFNFTGLGRNRPHIRVGHIELPYGLEQLIDTNGTLRQLGLPRNLGVKADWGVTVNGETRALEYEVGLSRGTGQRISGHGGPFVVAGRVGSPRHRRLVVGMSAMHGRIVNPGAVALWRHGFSQPIETPSTSVSIRRTRVGVDMHSYAGPFRLMGEVSVGRDYQQAVVNSLVGVDWNNPPESLTLYLQATEFMQRYEPGWVDAVSVAVGMKYRPTRGLTVSGEYSHALTTFEPQKLGRQLRIQLRWRL